MQLLPQLPKRWTRESEFLSKLRLEGEARERFLDLLLANSQAYYPKLRYYANPALFYYRYHASGADDDAGEREYILKSSLPFPPKPCWTCPNALRAWTLIGGGYQTNDTWYAALLREALPLIICETCFRMRFVVAQEERDLEVIESGIAVLPALQPVVQIKRQLQIERYLIALRKKHAARNAFFELDNFLLQQEISQAGLVPSIHVRVHTGQVKLLYSFARGEDDAGKRAQFHISFAGKQQTSLVAMLGFQLETMVQIEQKCLGDGLCILRSVKDFYWLRDELGATGRFVPPLPGTQNVGFFLDSFVQVKLASLERFLTLCCQDGELRKHKSLEAFFRKGFSLARCVIECREEDEAQLRQWEKKTARAVVVAGAAAYIERQAEYLQQSLLLLSSAETDLAQLHCDFSASLGLPATPAQALVPPPVSKTFDLQAFVRARIHQSSAQVEQWRALQDYLQV